MKRIFTLILLTVGIVAAALGQAPQPVRWRILVKPTGNDTGVITFRAIVTDGWHLYGLELPQNGPKPTVFDLAASTDIKFTGKLTPSRKALDIEDPMFGITLSWWDSNVEFSIPFKVTGDTPVLRCTINYMTCDGNTCMPPARESITTPIKLNQK